nr:T9SS type A sorting domain-containing protein [Flavobacteriales bacterium]
TTLTVQPVAGVKQLQVLDLQGRIVATHGLHGADQVTLNVDVLLPGVYLLRGDDGRQLGRFAKE